MAAHTTHNNLPNHIPFAERPTCSVNEAIMATSLGLTSIYALIGSGQLETTRVGSRTLIKVPSLLRLIEQGADPKPRSVPVRRGSDHYRSKARAGQ